LARFFAESLATTASGLARCVSEGSEAVFEVSPDQLSA